MFLTLDFFFLFSFCHQNALMNVDFVIYYLNHFFSARAVGLKDCDYWIDLLLFKS